MTLAHDRLVLERFDAMQERFRPVAPADDYRLLGVTEAVGDVRGLRVLDLGCGKGRFARHLQAAGAEVVALDPSGGMLAHASGLDRVRASASRLPFPPRCFDRAIAIEVFEHLSRPGCLAALSELRRVVRPGGVVAIADKNARALDSRRPWLPKVLVKRIDERRGLWMYPSGGPIRERWFHPGAMARLLRRDFADVRVRFLLSPEESRLAVFRAVPAARLMALWTARVPEGPR